MDEFGSIVSFVQKVHTHAVGASLPELGKRCTHECSSIVNISNVSKTITVDDTFRKITRGTLHILTYLRGICPELADGNLESNNGKLHAFFYQKLKGQDDNEYDLAERMASNVGHSKHKKKNLAEYPIQNPTPKAAKHPTQNTAENPTQKIAENPTENPAENQSENQAENPAEKTAAEHPAEEDHDQNGKRPMHKLTSQDINLDIHLHLLTFTNQSNGCVFLFNHHNSCIACWNSVRRKALLFQGPFGKETIIVKYTWSPQGIKTIQCMRGKRCCETVKTKLDRYSICHVHANTEKGGGNRHCESREKYMSRRFYFETHTTCNGFLLQQLPLYNVCVDFGQKHIMDSLNIRRKYPWIYDGWVTEFIKKNKSGVDSCGLLFESVQHCKLPLDDSVASTATRSKVEAVYVGTLGNEVCQIDAKNGQKMSLHKMNKINSYNIENPFYFLLVYSKTSQSKKMTTIPPSGYILINNQSQPRLLFPNGTSFDVIFSNQPNTATMYYGDIVRKTDEIANSLVEELEADATKEKKKKKSGAQKRRNKMELQRVKIEERQIAQRVQKERDESGRKMKEMEEISKEAKQEQTPKEESKQEKEVANQSFECVLCMNKTVNCTFVHGETGHVCCCLECANAVKKKNNLCPICRLPIDSIVRLFVS